MTDPTAPVAQRVPVGRPAKDAGPADRNWRLGAARQARIPKTQEGALSAQEDDWGRSCRSTWPGSVKQNVTTLKMVPIPEAVSIPFVFRLLDGGNFRARTRTHATVMPDELRRWTDALHGLRARSHAAMNRRLWLGRERCAQTELHLNGGYRRRTSRHG